MKKLYRNIREGIIKTLVLSLSLIFSSIVYGRPELAVAISDLNGRAFYSYEGTTKTLKVGQHIPVGADIFTEEGSQLQFNDYYNHKFILSGSGHVTVTKKTMNLKSGYLWVQTLTDDKNEYLIQTANSEVSYTDGEGIVSFDPFSGKTQILVLKGEYYFKNLLYKENYVSVRDGRFSFISNDVNDGLPRSPTPIGYSSFKRVTGLFRGINTLEDQAEKQKMVTKKSPEAAPVVRQVYTDIPKQDQGFEKVLEQSRGRVPSSEASNVKEVEKVDTEKLLNSYLSELAKKKPASAKKPASVKKSANPSNRYYKGYKRNKVKVNIFGASVAPKKSKSRMPASAPNHKNYTTIYGKKAVTKKYNRAPASLGNMLPTVIDKSKHHNSFENNLMKEYKHQKRHSDEMNTLIDKLQSVDMDFQKDY